MQVYLPSWLPVSVSDLTHLGGLAPLSGCRYHFAGGVDAHFARLPYINKDLGAGPRATRFISLAPISSQGKGIRCVH
jgi:hypothetical protein